MANKCKCIPCTNNACTTARGFKLTKHNFEETCGKVREVVSSPAFDDDNSEWTIYRVRGSEWCAHSSLLIESSASENVAFAIHLFVVNVTIIDEKSRRRTMATVIPGIKKENRQSLAKKNYMVEKIEKIQMSGKNIVYESLQCLEGMGDYHYITNNCQDFCEKFTKELGLETKMTDYQWMKVIGGAVFAIGAVTTALLVGAKTMNKSKK